MAPENNPADDDEHGECRQEIENLTALLSRVYREAGNESPGFKRHALTPGLRDDIRDCLKSSGRLGQISPSNEPEEPEPDTCCECGEVAVGYDECSPYCAAHYSSRQPVIDARAERDLP